MSGSPQQLPIASSCSLSLSRSLPLPAPAPARRLGAVRRDAPPGPPSPPPAAATPPASLPATPPRAAPSRRRSASRSAPWSPSPGPPRRRSPPPPARPGSRRRLRRRPEQRRPAPGRTAPDLTASTPPTLYPGAMAAAGGGGGSGVGTRCAASPAYSGATSGAVAPGSEIPVAGSDLLPPARAVCRYKENRWDAKQLVGSGGMPSSHSATVTALAVAVGLQEGLSSSLFATAAVFASVGVQGELAAFVAAGAAAEPSAAAGSVGCGRATTQSAAVWGLFLHTDEHSGQP